MAESFWEREEYREPPGVVRWFKVYVVVLSLMYVLVAGVGLMMVSDPGFMVDPDASPVSNRPASLDEAVLMGWIYGVVGVVLLAAFLGWFLVPRSKGKWVYGIVLIAIGMTSICTLPATIPLLIFWIKDDCRTYFAPGVGNDLA